MLKRALVLILCAALPAATLAGGYGGRHYYGGYHHRHHGGGYGGALLAGLVVGGLFGYLISEDRHYRRSAYPSRRYGHRPYFGGRYSRYSSYDYGYRDYGYRDYSYRSRAYREYIPVRPKPRPEVVRRDPNFAGHDCRMTREYTTTVEIAGQPREAYGTRCLTADGTWVLGTPRVEPRFQ